jgi:hypothetical protein
MGHLNTYAQTSRAMRRGAPWPERRIAGRLPTSSLRHRKRFYATHNGHWLVRVGSHKLSKQLVLS